MFSIRTRCFLSPTHLLLCLARPSASSASLSKPKMTTTTTPTVAKRPPAERQQQQYALLDPPFSPVKSDERTSRGANKYFSVICTSCRFPLFSSRSKVLGYPAWPTFSAPLATAVGVADNNDVPSQQEQQHRRLSLSQMQQRIKMITDDVQDLEMSQISQQRQRSDGDARDGRDREKKSLILRDAPPTMRWGLSAAVGREQLDKKSKGFAEYEHREAREKKAKTFRGFVNESKQLRALKIQRTAPAVCRGYCGKCNSFICVVVHGAKDSDTGMRFVVNPSSVSMTD